MDELINFLFEAQILSRLQKSGIEYLRGPVSDTVASHSFLTVLTGWILAFSEKADESKVIKLCLIHDIVESRIKDQNIMNLIYLKKIDEKKVFKEIFEELPASLKKEFNALIAEFLAGKTKEARISKDASKLAWMIIIKECLVMGNKQAKKWLHFSLAQLKTKSGKQLGKKLIKAKIDDWWLNVLQKKFGISDIDWKKLLGE